MASHINPAPYEFIEIVHILWKYGTGNVGIGLEGRTQAFWNPTHLFINLCLWITLIEFCLVKESFWDNIKAPEDGETLKVTMASPLEMTEMYDNALLGILQHVGNIQDFLQVYFGFLYRKTDFYRLLSGPDDKMGFPPGVAEKMVFKVKFVNMLTCCGYRIFCTCSIFALGLTLLTAKNV